MTVADPDGRGSAVRPFSGDWAGPGRRLPRPATAALAFALYLGLTSLFIGRQALAHMGSVAIAPNDIDSSQYQWFLAWWPHALLHGLNPFVTHAVYVPGGYNLTWTTSLAAPSLLLAPVTLLFGPTAAFNVFGLLAPTLSACAAFALCRHITGRVWPSLVGGYVFGFSGFVLTTVQGEPWLACAGLIPAVALLVLKRLEGSLERTWFVALMAGAIIVQFLTSAEVLTTATMFGCLVMSAGWVLFRERRRALLVTAAEVAVAYLAGIVLLSPFLYFMLQPHTSPLHATFFVGPTDPIAFFVPSQLQLGGTWQVDRWAQLGVPASQDTFAYLGLPLLLVVVAVAARGWRERSVQMLTACFVVALVAVMGTRLVIVGHDVGLPLPWQVLRHLPLLRYALPFRAAVYAALLAALILATWLARGGGALRWGVALLVVASLIPSLSSPYWHSSAVDPPFFAHGDYRRYLSRSDNVVTIPVDGQNQRWQARTGFAFNIVGGYLGAFPAAYTRFAAWNALLNGVPSQHWPQALRTYLKAKHATVILVDKRYGPRWRHLFMPLGITPIDTAGVLLYRLEPASRAGG